MCLYRIIWYQVGKPVSYYVYICIVLIPFIHTLIAVITFDIISGCIQYCLEYLIYGIAFISVTSILFRLIESFVDISFPVLL